MAQQEQPRRSEWRKPELVKIGSISDVAGKPIPFDQAANNSKS